VRKARARSVQPGVPAYKIQTGAFGNPQMQREGRVEVLVGNQ
jgi:hypothetical protein